MNKADDNDYYCYRDNGFILSPLSRRKSLLPFSPEKLASFRSLSHQFIVLHFSGRKAFG
jgi:hypothetical protein